MPKKLIIKQINKVMKQSKVLLLIVLIASIALIFTFCANSSIDKDNTTESFIHNTMGANLSDVMNVDMTVDAMKKFADIGKTAYGSAMIQVMNEEGNTKLTQLDFNRAPYKAKVEKEYERIMSDFLKSYQ